MANIINQGREFGKKEFAKKSTIAGAMTQALVPVISDVNQHCFLMQGKEKIGGDSIFKDDYTAPLRASSALSLIAISTTEQALAAGVIDQTDELDHSTNLIEVTLGYADEDPRKTEWVIDVENQPLTNFVTVQNGNYYGQALDFSSEFVLAPSASIVENGEVVRIKVRVYGSLNMQTSDIEVNGLITSVSDDMSDSIKEVLNGLKVTGYRLSAHRVNYNRRPI